MSENKQLLEPFLESDPNSDKENNKILKKKPNNLNLDDETKTQSAQSHNSSDSDDDEMHIYDLPKVDHTKAVMRKLLTVSVVCLILMCAEVVGGYLANSLAIMTDAAHLFSDLSGFFISVFSLFMSKRAASNSMSFGYHRAEVIGALASVILIWGLTIWLCYEATMRLVYQKFEINGLIMLVTSCFALLANLVMAKILHSSGHAHSHGGKACGGHGGHSHSHGADKKDNKELKDSKEKKDHGHSHKEGKCHGHGHGGEKKKIEDKEQKDQPKVQENEQKKPEQHGHSHKNGKQCHGHSHSKKETKNPISVSKEFDDEKAKPAIQITMQEFQKPTEQQQQQQQDNDESDKAKQQQQQQQIDIPQQQKPEQELPEQKSSEEKKKEKKSHGHSHSHGEHGHSHAKKKVDLDDAFVEKGYEGEKDSKHDKGDSESESGGATRERNLSQIEEKDNPNLRAAMIHIIGDTLQSIGVILAAVIIYSFQHKYKNIKLADPICTFVFAILVIFTTVGVTKDCIRVLMEGTPVGFDLNDFRRKLNKCAGVIEVHDLHLWQLSVGKPSLSCHILSSNPNKSLKQATNLCRKYGIYHSTIQVEDKVESEKENFIKCHQNIHVDTN